MAPLLGVVALARRRRRRRRSVPHKRRAARRRPTPNSMPSFVWTFTVRLADSLLSTPAAALARDTGSVNADADSKYSSSSKVPPGLSPPFNRVCHPDCGPCAALVHAAAPGRHSMEARAAGDPARIHDAGCCGAAACAQVLRAPSVRRGVVGAWATGSRAGRRQRQRGGCSVDGGSCVAATPAHAPMPCVPHAATGCCRCCGCWWCCLPAHAACAWVRR